MKDLIRKLHADESGQSPWLVMASVTLFLIVSAGLAVGLTLALTTTAMLQTNTTLKEAASAVAQQATMQGYTAVAALPASATIQLQAGDGTTVDANRRVTVAPSGLSARVTVTVGAATSSGRTALSECITAPERERCIVSTEVVSQPRTAP